MYNPASPNTKRLLAALLLMNVSACGWVDSTGVQGTTVAVAFHNAQPVAIIEGTSLSAPLAGEGADLRNWRWKLDDSDVRSRCASISGFEVQLAATSLADACSGFGECRVLMEESSDENNTTVFTLTMPALRSPVALNYRLSATRDDGAVVEREQLLCGLPVNEAPVASDNNYLALLDELLVINASDSNNLLANDHDDDDIRNKALSVTGITRKPAYASQFSFDDKGGFIYAVSAIAPVNSNGYAEDSFVYSITDGLHVTQGTAFIKIGSGNTAPTQTQKIPDLSVHAATAFSAPESLQFDLSQYFRFSYNVSNYFSDIDDDELSFSATGMPEDVSISTRGIISGQASDDNRGKWIIRVTADDGNGGTVSDGFQLQIK